MTFKQMQDRVKLTLGMNETVSNDETVLIKAWINEGVVDLISRTRPYTRVINLTVQPGVEAHDMSSAILSLVDIETTEDGFLRRYSRQDIRDAQKSGTPGFAYEEPLLWISPIVSTATIIKAYGIFRPADLVGDTDDLATAPFGGLAEEFHPAVLDYAMWKAGEYVQHQESASGEKWRMAYEGQDGFGGDIAHIKRILAKRVTPQAAGRRNLSRNLGVPSLAGDWIGG